MFNRLRDVGGPARLRMQTRVSVQCRNTGSLTIPQQSRPDPARWTLEEGESVAREPIDGGDATKQRRER